MTLLIILSIAYFFFMTKFGKELFGIMVQSIIFYGIVFLNPISLILFFGLFLIIKGVTG